jgi:hypothetical protein
VNANCLSWHGFSQAACAYPHLIPFLVHKCIDDPGPCDDRFRGLARLREARRRGDLRARRAYRRQTQPASKEAAGQPDTRADVQATLQPRCASWLNSRPFDTGEFCNLRLLLVLSAFVPLLSSQKHHVSMKDCVLFVAKAEYIFRKPTARQ